MIADISRYLGLDARARPVAYELRYPPILLKNAGVERLVIRANFVLESDPGWH